MRRISLRTWITLIVTGFLTASATLFGNIGAGALTFLSPQIALILFVLISATLIALDLWRGHTESSAELSPALQQQNRERMLDRVYRKWIVEYLEDDLRYDEELIHLPLRKLSTGRWDLAIQRLDAPAQPLPADTRITEVYDQALEGELLILGDPGIGKTTLLLELTRDLIERARMQDDSPIPVVFTLSSWAAKQRSIEEWLIEELWTKYQVQRQIGRVLVENHQMFLLLDGLDEVAPAYQEACIEALNEYRRAHKEPMVVSSRKDEYLHLSTQLHLRTAVLVQPLTLQQIDAYLTELGGEVAGLQVALRKSTTLQQLATTPFMLKVLILTYHDLSVRELLTLVSAPSTDLLQYQLFHSYSERMLQHPVVLTHYTVQQVRYWLVWLAQQMAQHNQIEFYIERIQPDWLPSPWLIWLYRIVIGLIGGLIGGLFLVFGLVFGQSVGLLYGLAIVLFFVLVTIDNTEIKPAETIVWSWKNKNMRQRSIALFITMLLVALVIGLIVGLLHGVGIGLISGLSVGLLGLVLSGLSIGLIGGFSSELLNERNLFVPNQGIWSSARNSIFVGLICMLIGGLLFGLAVWLIGGLSFGLSFGLSAGLIDGLAIGLINGLVGGLTKGGNACIRHIVLRLLLWCARCTPRPWHYVAFLDDRYSCHLLRKVGGGYLFRHRLLRDYFASLASTPTSTFGSPSLDSGEQQM